MQQTPRALLLHTTESHTKPGTVDAFRIRDDEMQAQTHSTTQQGSSR